jgi:3-hydroxybutyryl-CoA dehydrogenase
MLSTKTTVAVVGLGSVGGALLAMLDAAGFATVGVDVNQDRLRRYRGPATVGSGLGLLRDADIVVECLPEDFATKAQTYPAIAATVYSNTPLISTAFRLSLPALATAAGRPDRLVGWRMLAPPSYERAVGVVPTTMTHGEVIKTAEDLLDALGVPRTVFTCHEAASDLVLSSLNRAVALADNGYAAAEDIDQAMRLGLGLPVGPFSLLEQMGLDTAHRRLTDLSVRTGLPTQPARGLSDLVGAGRHGLKSGGGFAPRHGSTRSADLRSPRRSEVTSVGVVGSGVMACGIGQVAAAAGVCTVLLARSPGKAAAAIDAIGSSLERAVRRGKISPDERRGTLARIHATDDWSALAGCEVVLEAVAEDSAIKQKVFAKIDEHASPGALLATTTSSLAVRSCAAATRRDGDVVGLHFFNPAPAMRLVEVVFTEASSDSAVAGAAAFARQLGKTPVVCGDETGFLVNYLLFSYLHDAVTLVERGAHGIDEIDHDITQGFGYPMGPFTLMDTIGLDISAAIQERMYDAGRGAAPRPSAMLTQLVRLGHLGKKNGTGFHQYSK